MKTGFKMPPNSVITFSVDKTPISDTLCAMLLLLQVPRSSMQRRPLERFQWLLLWVVVQH
jgi:hypothetical protein